MSVETEVIKDDTLRYDAEEIYYGQYKHIQVYPDEGSSGQTIDAGGGTQHTIPIGSQYVVNLAESYLNLQVTVAGNPTTNNWSYADVLGFVRDIDLQPESGQHLYYLQEAQVWQKISNRMYVQQEDFKTLDTDWVDAGDGFTRSASAPFYPSHKEQARNKIAANGVDVAIPYDAPQACIRCNRVNNSNTPANSMFLFKIPLYYFRGIFSVNKDLYFGQQCNLILTYEGLNKWLWEGTSATNPSTGATVTGSTSANVQAFLDLAVEQNQDIINQIKAKVMSEGMTMIVPYVQRVYKNTFGATTSQNISNVTLNRGHGLRLLRVWYGIFNSTQLYNTYLDNYNVATSTTVKSRVDYFQTFMDGIPLQVKPMYSGGIPSATQANNDDYKFLKWRLKGSCVQSMIDYYQNWFWVDDWTQPLPRSAEEKDMPLSNKLQGFRLDDGAQHTWQLNMTTANAAYFHYVYIETLRVLNIGPGVVSLV